MKITRGMVALAVMSALASIGARAQDGRPDLGHAVFVMTNDAQSNEIIAYSRTEYGTLTSPHKFKTGGGAAAERAAAPCVPSVSMSVEHRRPSGR